MGLPVRWAVELRRNCLLPRAGYQRKRRQDYGGHPALCDHRSPAKRDYRFDSTQKYPEQNFFGLLVKPILNKYGYPPDLQEEAVKKVISRAGMLCAELPPE